MYSPVPSESPDPPAAFSELRLRNGDGERPSWVAAAEALSTYQTRKSSMWIVAVPAVVSEPSVTWYVNVSFWFLSPTPGRNVKLPSLAIVAVPPPVEVTVSATAVRVCGNVASWSVSFAMSVLPVSVTCGPLAVVCTTASVFPIAPEYESGFATGASFTSLIVIVNCLSNERFGVPESVVRTQIVYELFVSKSKLTADFRSPPEVENEPLSGNGPPPQPVVGGVE